VFATVHDAPLFQAHNELHFYTWGDQRCCLPRGVTRATLRGHLDQLRAGDVLAFEEVLGPRTGERDDADPTQRQAVRLTRVTHSDAKGHPLIDPLNQQLITEIEWAADDALTVPFCISAMVTTTSGERFIDDVTVARGNIVLADHGAMIGRGSRRRAAPLPLSSAGEAVRSLRGARADADPGALPPSPPHSAAHPCGPVRRPATTRVRLGDDAHAAGRRATRRPDWRAIWRTNALWTSQFDLLDSEPDATSTS
jgi:hypothetical protein